MPAARSLKVIGYPTLVALAKDGSEISRIQGEMARETQWHMQRRAQIRAQTREEVAGIYSGIARSRSESSDRMHRESVRVIREVEHYRVPGGSGTAVTLFCGEPSITRSA